MDTASVVWLEAEQFDSDGGWANDSQHVDRMGSPYLLATGVGSPVEDAVTIASIPSAGKYRLWVRCKDWLPEHSPGQFQVLVGNRPPSVTFGKATSDAWQWVDGGLIEIEAGVAEVRLHDLTGWWGRCDAVVLATPGFEPSNESPELAAQRARYGGVSAEIEPRGPHDVVVVGGGPAGLGAALAAARHGCRVALIQDRPVLGGNASSEISIPPMGYIGDPPDTVNVSGIAEELFPPQDWHRFADSKRIESIVRAERNIALFLGVRMTGAEMDGDDRIRSVMGLDVRTGQRMSFSAPRFIDCTGHGWLGYYAGAEYRMGQEAREEFGESLAPVEAGKRTMGNSLYVAEFRENDDPTPFDCPTWAYSWRSDGDFEPRGSHGRIKEVRRPENFDSPSHGKGRNPQDDVNGGLLEKWWIEFGGMHDTIADAELIRDELFRISIGLWNYAKNHNPGTKEANANRELIRLNYVPGVRESRRLVGDYLMAQRDYDDQTVHADTVAFTDWGIDVHHPEGFWVRGNDCIHVYGGRRTSIPYRTLYSGNIGNLFMAGRCHSATHIALGGTRVMRPVCAMGQAAGTAAALARKHDATPRGVYESHLEELLQALLRDGCYLIGVRNRDPRDLARRASVSASSAAPGTRADYATNGFSRTADGCRNAWQPDPESAGPQWLGLALEASAEIDTVHVTFESQSAPFAVQAWADGVWQTVAEVGCDTPRRTVLSFGPLATDKLRIRIDRPSVETAICEARLYRDGEAS